MKANFDLWLIAQIDKLGITKREAATRSGMSDALLYQVTTYGKVPTVEFCVKIAKGLNLPTVEVLHRAGHPIVREPRPPGDTTDPWASEAWQLVQRVPESDRVTVLKMLRGIVS